MNLDTLRREIDRIDREIVRLLNERTKLAMRIGRVKKSNGTPVFVPEREKEVHERVGIANRGPFPDAALRRIYGEIMSASRSLELEDEIKVKAPAKKQARRKAS